VARFRIHVLAVLISATMLAVGCGEDAGLDGASALASSPEQQCRGRTDVIVVMSSSRHPVVGIRIEGAEDAQLPLQLAVKERTLTFTRYEVLWQDCGPTEARRRRLLIDLPGGTRLEGDLTLEPDSNQWFVVTPPAF
jgi:hypothetical protein